MEKERKKYPIGAEHYNLYEEVGTGVSASVHRALCVPLNEIVAIKILDFERNNCDLNNVSREAQTMVLLDHPNVLKSHCTFVNDHNLWFVMPFMAGGSCLHILKAAHPDGFEEVVIATILKEVLKGLDYLHQHGHIHRDVKAGNILIDTRGTIKLGDLGVSAYLFDCGDRQRMRNTFVGTPCWMAPEVLERLNGYDFKADIWSFGITALELAHGHAPFSKYPPMKVLLMTLQNAPPGLDYESDRKFSKSFKQMTGRCLMKDPTQRPSAKKLLKHSFFKKARSNDYIARTLLEGLPAALGDRLQALKQKEEDMLAQKQMPDGQLEEISQNEYKRGISSWNFNLDDLKAQASVIQDDDFVAEKDEDAPAKQLQQQLTISKNSKVLQHQLSFASQCSDASDDKATTSVSSVESSTNIVKCEKSDDDIFPDSTTEQPATQFSFRKENQAESNLAGKPVLEVKRKISEGSPTSSSQRPINMPSSENAQLEIANKCSKTLVNGDEADEKAKNQVVQQKGRFKVTSESVETEKVGPLIQKSHSIQVISPVLTSSMASASEANPPNPYCHSLFPTLQSILQTNITQRDQILGAVKQLSLGDYSAVGCNPMITSMTEKSLLEIAHEKEKELLREISDLQWRLICAQQELQKYKQLDNPRMNP